MCFWAIKADWQGDKATPWVDAAMSASDWTLQLLSDTIGAPIDCSVMTEITRDQRHAAGKRVVQATIAC